MELFTKVLYLLVGVSIFLISLRMMANGLRKSAGKGVRELFSKTKNSRLTNFGIGVATTAVIQSSDATSVMVIGFISAGVLTLFQGICIILGAYVGTTATGLIVSLSSFSFSTYLLSLAVIGVIMSFFKNEQVKNIGEILTGLGFLFFSLSTMSSVFATDSPLYEIFAKGANSIELLPVSPLLFFIIGILFTLITQSSSATSGIVIVLVGSSVIDLGSGFYLVLGATIGSVMPTLLASIGGIANVKRTGFICVLLKSIPAVLCLSIVWPLESAFVDVFKTLFANTQLALAMFLFSYSLIAMLIQLLFVNNYIRLSEKVIVDNDSLKKQSYLKFIDNRLLTTPKVAMSQVKKEVKHMLDLSYSNLQKGFDEIFSQKFDDKDVMEETEDAIDFINSEITSYLISLSPKVGHKDEIKVGGYFHMINDIERIGDHAYNFLDMTQQMFNESLQFSNVAHDEFLEMFNVIKEMFKVAFDIFENKSNLTELHHLHELEDQTDKLKLKLSAAHFARITDKSCKVELSYYYSTLVSELERVADHLVNIGYAFVNPTGDDSEDKQENK